MLGPLGVAITLQTLVVSLCGLVLGFGRGTAAVGLYILLGLIGLPIFSGFRAGPAVLASPSAGYIIGFIFGVAVVGLLAAWPSAAAGVPRRLVRRCHGRHRCHPRQRHCGLCSSRA